MDEQEKVERELAAQAYAGESPGHFVSYVEECVKEDLEATKDIRQIWDECWKAHQTQIDYADKEDWQAKCKTNDPFIAVQRAKSIVRRALQKPDFYLIEGVESGDKDFSNLIKNAFDFFLNPQHVNFPIVFSMASEMGLAVGQSMELIPMWENPGGLTLIWTEPWKISRDPDALPYSPWSGSYWIHTEWMDMWRIKNDPAYDQDAIEKLKPEEPKDKDKDIEHKRQMYFKRSKYRPYVRVRDFWGTVLSPKGELLLESSHFMTAADQVILPPTNNAFETIPWPGVSFSPFAHILRFQGIGILEGVLSLWWIICNLMNLDIDNFTWVVNKMTEIDPSMMADPSDFERYPGKMTVRKTGASGSIFNEVGATAHTADVLARIQQWYQMFQNGSTVNQFVEGSPGTRANITKGEVEIKTQQSLGIFDSIGRDLEVGAVNVLWVIYETIMLNWSVLSAPSIERVLGDQYDDTARIFAEMDKDTRRQILKSKCDITVSGISAELQQWDKIDKLQPFFADMQSPIFSQYIRPYNLLKQRAELMGFHEPDFLMTDEEIIKMRKMQATEVFKLLNPLQQEQIMMAIKDLMQGGMRA